MPTLILVAALLLGPQDSAGAGPAPDAVQERAKKVERVTLPRGKNRAPLFMELSLAAAGDPAPPLLVLYHAARSGKAEYRPMVPRFQALGYHCLAVDLSSGGESRGVRNNTARSAREGGKNPTYLDAIPDMLDSLRWAREHHAGSKVVVVGSSYSASLALCLAAEHPELIDGVIAFSPGEYFTAVQKSATWVQESVKGVACPVLVAAAPGEESEWQAIFAALGSEAKTSFVPAGPGSHGAQALWEENPGSAEYWAAVEAFLQRHFPAPAKAPPKDG